MPNKISSNEGGTVTDQLEQLTPIQIPREIIAEDTYRYMGNLVRSLYDINIPSTMSKYDPIEYMYLMTKEKNDKWIYIKRYTELPYWNKRYSHPIMEEMSNFEWKKDDATHVYDSYANTVLHIALQKGCTADTGYHVNESSITFTY